MNTSTLIFVQKFFNFRLSKDLIFDLIFLTYSYPRMFATKFKTMCAKMYVWIYQIGMALVRCWLRIRIFFTALFFSKLIISFLNLVSISLCTLINLISICSNSFFLCFRNNSRCDACFFYYVTISFLC